MIGKKFILAFILVFIVLEITGYIVHGVLLADTYTSEGVKGIFRAEEEMWGNMWLIWLMDLVWSYFFVFFFAKGYENKGLMEGVRFGIYIGLFYMLVFAYQAYAVHPIPYSLALQWFIYGLIQCVLVGIVAALVYKPSAPAQETA
jgi:hypothetical protein